MVERDLEDAEIEALCADRRFATAYNAVLQVARMVIACAGYRIAGQGHHRTTFQAVRLAMGTPIGPLAVDYDMAGVATDTEVAQPLVDAERFRVMAGAWIAQNHPHCALPQT